LHKHRHNFEKGHKIEGRRGQIEPLRMGERHDELAAEMERRGMNHKSPFLPPSLNNYDGEYLRGFTVDHNMSILDLQKRCPECKKRLDEIAAM